MNYIIILKYTARHKTNANYGNLVYDKVEKRMTKIATRVWPSSWAKKLYYFVKKFLTQLEGQTRVA